MNQTSRVRGVASLLRFAPTPLGTGQIMQEDIPMPTKLEQTARRLWTRAQANVDPSKLPPADLGLAVAAVTDADIADEAEVDISVVRAYLDLVDGKTFAVGRDGETRTVKAPLSSE